MSGALPVWAESVLAAWAPAPAFGEVEADAAALARYRQIDARIRARWRAELQPHVWSRFQGRDEQAAVLLGLMIDMARFGSQRELAAKRQALEGMARLEDELRALSRSLILKADELVELGRRNAVLTGLDADALRELRGAAETITVQSWREPTLAHGDHADAISSRKTQRDALVAMLGLLELYAPQFQPVELTDEARAAIFNVVHDMTGEAGYSAPAIKKARADLRRLR